VRGREATAAAQDCEALRGKEAVVADGCGAGEGRTRGKEAAVMAALEREERGVREGRGAREKRGGREGVGE